MTTEAYFEGIRAYYAYESRDSNPYGIDTDDVWSQYLWDMGYSSAKHGYVDENGQPKE